MRFSDQLRVAFERRRESDAAALRPVLRKAGLAVIGLCLLPVLAAGTWAGSGRALLAVAAVGAVAFALRRHLGARATPQSPAPTLRVLARVSLSAKNAVALLEVEGRHLVVAYGDGFTELLSTDPHLPAAAGVSTGAAISPRCPPGENP